MVELVKNHLKQTNDRWFMHLVVPRVRGNPRFNTISANYLLGGYSVSFPTLLADFHSVYIIHRINWSSLTWPEIPQLKIWPFLRVYFYPSRLYLWLLGFVTGSLPKKRPIVNESPSSIALGSSVFFSQPPTTISQSMSRVSKHPKIMGLTRGTLLQSILIGSEGATGTIGHLALGDGLVAPLRAEKKS